MNIIITGASKGIGAEVVKVLSKSKVHHIVAISRNGKALAELASECNRGHAEANVTPYEFDLTQTDFYPFIVQRLSTIIPRCDILINNAGRLVNRPFDKITPVDFDEVYNVNIRGPFFFIQALLPMMNKGSHIVNIGSMGGIAGAKKRPGLSAYTSSKGALAALTEILAEELAPRDIRVNCLALGSVQTDMFANAFPGMKAVLAPAQIAQYIADFATTGHRYFNGKILPVTTTTP
ncbi:MAG: SDR family oxidoreductase [Bacteroidales bacterium]|nr:SDR family oxidoreductase [Bacteroidales bacterium]